MHFKVSSKIIFASAAIIGLQLMTIGGTANASSKKSTFKAVNPNEQQEITISLKGRNNKDLDKFIYQTVTPGNDNYRKYLSPNQFGQKYGLSDQNVKVVGKYMQKNHLKVYTYPGNLVMNVSGKTKDIEKTFKVKLKQTTYKKHRNYQTKSGKYYLPKSIAKHVTYVVGFSRWVSGKTTTTTQATPSYDDPTSIKDSNISDQSYLKFGRNYNTDSIYQNNNGGQNQTIGIISLSDFKLKDVQEYLKKENVDSDLNRIKKVYIDHDLSKEANESTMDAEQASAIAPKANVTAYVGGNMINDYAAAIGRDNVDVITNSYGGFEKNMSPKTKEYGFNQTVNALLQQAAAQGITTFAASGDNGPYAFQDDSTKQSLSVPANSPYTTAAGGTTLPFKDLPFSYVSRYPFKNDKKVSLDKEHSWSYGMMVNLYGRDYMRSAYKEMYTELMAKARTKKEKEAIEKQFKSSKKSTLQSIYGSGGGFSKLFALPAYQKGVSGTQTYNAKQIIDLKKIKLTQDPKLISGTKPGRNVPDISANADPYTGYDVYLNGKMYPGGGGTSVVSPQFAGMAAVLNSAQGKRLGFWNPQIYRFAKTSQSPFTPLDSTDDDNLYYTGQPGKIYNQSTGLGTVDFTKLNQSFSNEK